MPNAESVKLEAPIGNDAEKVIQADPNRQTKFITFLDMTEDHPAALLINRFGPRSCTESRAAPASPPQWQVMIQGSVVP